MKLGLGLQDVGPFPHQSGREADGDGRRQRQSRDVEVRRRPVRRRLADQARQGVTGEAELLLQRRQERAVGGDLGVGVDGFFPRDAADAGRATHQPDVALVVLDHRLDRGDLGADGGDQGPPGSPHCR